MSLSQFHFCHRRPTTEETKIDDENLFLYSLFSHSDPQNIYISYSSRYNLQHAFSPRRSINLFWNSVQNYIKTAPDSNMIDTESSFPCFSRQTGIQRWPIPKYNKLLSLFNSSTCPPWLKAWMSQTQICAVRPITVDWVQANRVHGVHQYWSEVKFVVENGSSLMAPHELRWWRWLAMMDCDGSLQQNTYL